MLRSSFDRWFPVAIFVFAHQHIDEERKGDHAGHRADPESKLTGDQAANLVDDERDQIRKATLIANGCKRPFGAVHA